MASRETDIDQDDDGDQSEPCAPITKDETPCDPFSGKPLFKDSDPSSVMADFDILCTGIGGSHLEIIHKREVSPDINTLPLVTLPFGLPPVLPTVEEELEKYLTHPENLPLYDRNRTRNIPPRKSNPKTLYKIELTPVQTTIKVDRNPTTGELLGFKEEFITAHGTSQTSLSMQRTTGPPDQDLRGTSTSIPFWPGGLDEPEVVDTNLTQDSSTIDFTNDLLTIPPGFEKSMTFDVPTLPRDQTPVTISIEDILSGNEEFELGGGDDDDDDDDDDEGDHAEDNNVSHTKLLRSESLEKLVSDSSEVVMTTKEKNKHPQQEEWAVPIDISTPVDDFYKRVPEMACTWPFEPDIFQKQAILHLENHDSVFVAAHTSAGKTVVAEYAISLSMKHMTRTIYTSPIKALSNQKFREFKQRFAEVGDVGLITGDVQLRPEASCLIMTTEILRSMLYNGSDVIRDLEWVIFDEVHYINDADRGVVWEEVLIMLPKHVNIILLSATVPNTKEFAEWVGRTKRMKIYVISTLKRPVPLQHYLYTGNSHKTSNELFLVLDPDRKFVTRGYQQAMDAKKERASKSSQSFGAKGPRGGKPQQEKGVWLSVIDMLKKKDKLPVIAFTFSKRKIDENAANLKSVDLTTEKEKSEVHIFFQKCVSRLKGTDKELPQVLLMQDLLKRGIGVHHSGILPILKEVVEMLFQRGLVKILFSTETFAMGVNMPARSVVFDSIRKNDGTQFRDLLPGEYIQMAGRAGRRGLDTTGTVIVLCKGDVPEMSDLHKMMLGSPTKLESQFRLTYSMILNLLRVEQLRVEDMLKRSFSEFHTQKDKKKLEATFVNIKDKLSVLEPVECYMCGVDLEPYYNTCAEYWTLKAKLQKVVLSHPTTIKTLSAGRVVTVQANDNSNVLGTILATDTRSKERTFTVLILCNIMRQDHTKQKVQEGKNDDNHHWTNHKPVLANEQLFLPDGPSGHQVVQLKSDGISNITTKSLKINAERILDDFKKRQIPRFRDDPPGQSVTTVTQELVRLTESNLSGLPTLNPVKDLNIRDIDTIEEFRRLQFLYEQISKYQCVNCPTFMDHFHQMSCNMHTKDEYTRLKFLLSDESLILLPEYQQRIEVLKVLKYIDASHTVLMKGRVACEISNHELLITELIFENILTSLHPTEIAAILSCVVFEQKKCSEPKWTTELSETKDKVINVARQIGYQQKQHGMKAPVDHYVDKLHFGLVEVVFEWARGMPFSEITGLTDVQEGIIVRCIQRLDETLRDVRNAARIIGEPILFEKAIEASNAIKRDIVFAASLYTQ